MSEEEKKWKDVLLDKGKADQRFEPYVWNSIDCGDGWRPLVEAFYALVEKNPCMSVAQVKEKYGCYDDQTEVLTSGGWLPFTEATMETLFATLSGDGTVEYARPSHLTAEPYAGKMYQLVTRGVDLLVTPNHRLYVAKGTYWNGRHSPPLKVERPLEFATPDVHFGINKRFVKGGTWGAPDVEVFTLPEIRWTKKDGREHTCHPRDIPMDSWLTMLGWYLAEGCTDLKKASVSISYNNTDGGRERATVEAAIQKATFEPRDSSTDLPAGTFRIYSTHLARWLREHCGCRSWEKRLPRFVFDLSARQAGVLLSALYEGDGYRAPTAHTLTTVSKQLADDVQALILHAGGTSRLIEREPSPVSKRIGGRNIVSKRVRYEVNWMPTVDHNTSNKGLSPSSSEEWVEYDGMVYCATVPNGTLFVRRNGKPVWCGNSLRLYWDHDETKCKHEKWVKDEGMQPAPDRHWDELHGIVDGICYASQFMCEECGNYGKIRGQGWYKALCDKCEAEGK